MQTIEKKKILIAGVGNELRQDDAFGVLLARKLIDEATFPDTVTVLEFGIGGIHLVQELYNKYDILIILDAVKYGAETGTIHFREMEVKDISSLPVEERQDFIADMHYANPVRALMLAKALHVLSPKTFIVGCEVGEKDDFAIGISESTANGIAVAFKKMIPWVTEMLDDFKIKTLSN